MKAAISKGTDKEVAWSIDDLVTPELVQSIETAGDAMSLEWNESPFIELVELLIMKYSVEILEEMMYDEDPEIIPHRVQANTDPSTYDTLGRRYFVNLTYSFN